MQRVVAGIGHEPPCAEVSATFLQRWQLQGQLFETTYEVVECEPNRAFTYQSVSGAGSRLVQIHLQAAGGNTRITIRLQQEPAGLVPRDSASSNAATLLQTDVRTLKRIVESGRPAQ